jgi:hypothetical protein
VAGRSVALIPAAPDGSANELDRKANLAQLEIMVEQTLEMLQQVEDARDATVLVRRAGAAEKLVTEALRSCQAVEEEQFRLRQTATEAHLRTQRRAGELLMNLAKHRGGRRRRTDSTMRTVDGPATLRQLGIRPYESHRWQRIASVSAEVFEEIIREAYELRRELTTSSVLAIAKRLASRQAEAGAAARPEELQQELVQYRRAARQLRSVDPRVVVQGLDQRQRQAELGEVRSVRAWLDELERLLRSETARA